MPACEKCWEEAAAIAYRTGQMTADVYHQLLRDNDGKEGHE